MTKTLAKRMTTASGRKNDKNYLLEEKEKEVADWNMNYS